MESVRFLSFIVSSILTTSNLVHAALPYDPLKSLDWDSLDLYKQIAPEFKDENPQNPFPEFRTPDGTHNNIANEEWGSADSAVPRCLPAAYGDGFNSLSGSERMGAREISNVLSRQVPEESDEFVNERFLTQFVWQWGQFIDHDLNLISEARSVVDPNFDIDIYIPCGDPDFDPDDTCDANPVMQVFRTHSTDSDGVETGTDLENPRQQFNEITSYIDASMIYGSDKERADFLRDDTAMDGRLKEDDLGFLPRNNGDFGNEPNTESKFFIGGDVRVNEQLGLLTMHTIWVRFHNLLAEKVKESVEWSGVCKKNIGIGVGTLDDECLDEAVYQYTRLIVTAIVQKIVYVDWLPVLFGHTAMTMFLPEYDGYNETVDAGICPIFASAAYRLGHTFLPQCLPLRYADCSVAQFDLEAAGMIELEGTGINTGCMDLKQAFFVPQIAENVKGFFEALLNGMSCTLANEVDTFITGGVRNFLFFSSDLFEELDLVAINLQRGREHGLPDYNSVREQLGLGKLTDFSEITSKPELAEKFEVMYQGDIDDIDLFLPLLAEDHFEDGSFGETISSIVLGQFGRLRDGDRFFYQNYIEPGELMDFINCMTLKSIIELTTDIENIDAIDSIKHSVFQNKRAISIFENAGNFRAEAVPQSDIGNIPINQQQPKGDINGVRFKHYHDTDYNQKPQQQPNNKWYGIHYNEQPEQPGTFVIELTNFQIFILFAVSVAVIGCTCYSFIQFKKNKRTKYHAVKYDTETDTEASDREKLQS